MIASVYRPSRRKNGKRVIGRMYRGKYRLDPRDRLTDVALHTNDKQVAEQKLRKIVQAEQRERDGLLMPKQQRDAASAPLQTHINDYVADRRAVGRDEKYVRELERKLVKLGDECRWRRVAEVTPESFRAWRVKQRKNPKTLNEYLNAICGLMNWLEPRIGANPLRHVEKVQTNGGDPRRRAFTAEELQRLISVSGPRGVVYLIAAQTGIRRGELAQIEWRDVHLDATQPFISVRASVSKNHSHAQQPLSTEAVAALVQLRSTDAKATDLVFAGRLPRMPEFRKDLAAAGIDYVDARGEHADFHALRKTFGTLLTLSGVSQRTVMEMMRHSDMRLTAKTYTDAHMLPVSDAMSKLPRLTVPAADSQIDSQSVVPQRPAVSSNVRENQERPQVLTAGNQSFSPAESASVRDSLQTEDGARCRVRTCDFLRVKQALYH
jgi:integrase